jgi:hypothetical protein
VAFAVNAAEVAIPEGFVVAVLTPPAKLPEAPLDGVVKVTIAPLTGLPPESLTVATRGLLKAVLMVALCELPPLALIEAAAPAMLVSAKPAVVDTPDTLAVTE